MIKITYHTDENCRKGCHPVTYTDDRDKKHPTEVHICSIDEPGAWFDDKWNCHVDGTDYPFKSREKCIIWGLTVYGILDFEEPKKEKEKIETIVKKYEEKFGLTGE